MPDTAACQGLIRAAHAKIQDAKAQAPAAAGCWIQPARVCYGLLPCHGQPCATPAAPPATGARRRPGRQPGAQQSSEHLVCCALPGPGPAVAPRWAVFRCCSSSQQLVYAFAEQCHTTEVNRHMACGSAAQCCLSVVPQVCLQRWALAASACIQQRLCGGSHCLARRQSSDLVCAVLDTASI